MSRLSLNLVAFLLIGGCLASCGHPSGRAHSSAQTMQKFATPDAFAESVILLGGTSATRLHPDYIRPTLNARADVPAIKAAFDKAYADRSESSRQALIHALELKFIHDPKASALDLLGNELSAHFREFAWQPADFPGGPEGPNEAFADVMVEALDLVVPERRANSTPNAVVVRAEATEDVWDYMIGQWAPVPDQDPWKLNKHALESFNRMHAAAKQDGVDLVISSAHRDRKKAAANAARVGNPNAVASFSSHSLGLAIDFKLSQPSAEYPALSTEPMADVVKMRESPIHKWLCLHGAEFGWFPYQNEPWHWEYNPVGFRPTFWAEFPGGAPVRPLVMPTPTPTPDAGPMPTLYPPALTGS